MVVEKTLKDLLRLIWPLSGETKRHLSALKKFLSEEDLKYAKYLLKRKVIGVSYQSLQVGKQFTSSFSFPQINKGVPDKTITTTINTWNNRIRKAAEEKSFESFGPKAAKIIPTLLAPHIVGLHDAKEAAAWQLFSPERFHILLLGDPGTGKTEILRGAAQFANISSFGLGSGTSGVGLVGAKKGKDFVKGILPRAHKGVCCIDELNLMKSRDRGSLLNAMEKGFVTYDKGTTHKHIQAETRILATANPKGDRFVGDSIEFLKEQLPFDPALLSRFHLVFFIRRPTKEEFLKITRHLVSKQPSKITTDDINFVRDYVAFANKLNVEFDKSLEPVMTDFFDDLKEHEDEYLIELSPRLVLGVVRMAKARARMSLREKVLHEDLVVVLDVFKKSIIVAPDTVAAKRRRRS